MAVAVVGVSVGTYMAVDSLINNNVDTEQISQTAESQVKSQSFLGNRKNGLDDLKEIKVKTDDENVAFNVKSVKSDNLKDKFDDLIKRALHKENQNSITLEELIVAYEEFKNLKEFDFVNVKILQPKINKDGQLAFNEEQMIQDNDISIASIESLVELYDEEQELSDENEQKDLIQSALEKTKVAVASDPTASLEVVDLNLMNTKLEPKQPEVVAAVAPQAETTQTEVETTSSQTESDKPEVEVTPQPEPKQEEAVSNNLIDNKEINDDEIALTLEDLIEDEKQQDEQAEVKVTHNQNLNNQK